MTSLNPFGKVASDLVVFCFFFPLEDKTSQQIVFSVFFPFTNTVLIDKYAVLLKIYFKPPVKKLNIFTLVDKSDFRFIVH